MNALRLKPIYLSIVIESFLVCDAVEYDFTMRFSELKEIKFFQ
jgi:hypothetical protein